MQFRLTNKFNVAEDVVTFEWESTEPMTWLAGQFLKYTLPHENADDRGTTRWFTIAAPPYAGKPRITTRISADKGSSFKAALLALTVGDTIEASRPSGDFIVEDPRRQFVMVAGGIGITPYRAILLQLDHENADIHGRMLYANRNDQYVFKDEFETLTGKHADFAVRYFTAPQHIELTDMQTAAKELDHPLYYLSGPESMVEQYKGLLTGAGIAEEDIRADYFPGYGTI